MGGPIGLGKAVLGGVLMGLLAVAAFLGWLIYSNPVGESPSPDGAPSSVVAAFVMRDADGSSVAGAIFVVDSDGTITAVDSQATVAIPGTSFDQLQDTYAFGGGRAVSEGVASATNADSLPWVVIPETTWRELIDEAGGLTVEVPVAANVFAEDTLYSVSLGTTRLSGGEVAALEIAAGVQEDPADAASLRAALSDGLAALLQESWDEIVGAVESGAATSSLSRGTLNSFGRIAFGAAP
jgi:hypothetical protein